MPVCESMTGVDVIPISGSMNGHCTSPAAKGVSSARKRLACQMGVAAAAIGIEGVDGIVLGGNEEQVVNALTGHVHM